jgi:tRNA (cytidine/uridine-2'-O-)-methyltransferase
MFEIVLVEPEIAPNTGNVMRLCANTGCRLHLIEPLGFWLEDRRLRRAALDYREAAVVLVHESWTKWAEWRGTGRQSVFTSKGGQSYHQMRYQAGGALVFGPESRTAPDAVLRGFGPDARLRLPMVAGSRSLNLANAVAVVVYEAWRQAGFTGAGC